MKTRLFLVGSVLLISLQVFAQNDSLYQKLGVEKNLPVFYENVKKRLSFPFSWLSGNYSDFEQWKTEACNCVLKSLLSKPSKAEYNTIVLDIEDRGKYYAKKIVFNITADSRVLGYLLVPKGEGPFPAALLLHDHGARFDIGKEKVIKPFAVEEEIISSAKEWVNKIYGGKFIGDELAERGYVCLAVDALNWGDRGGGGYEGQQAIASNLLNLGMSYAGLIAWEDIYSAEYLASLAEVDKNKIAAVGLSMGAFRAWQVTALSDNICAGVATCSIGTTEEMMNEGNNKTKGQSAFTMTHPDLINYLDYPDVAAIACPKPMLFYNGKYDHLFPAVDVEKAYNKMYKYWQSQHAQDKLETKIWLTKHEFTSEMQNSAFNWLDVQLK